MAFEYIFPYQQLNLNEITVAFWSLALFELLLNTEFFCFFYCLQKKQRTKELSQLFHSYNPYDHKVRYTLVFVPLGHFPWFTFLYPSCFFYLFVYFCSIVNYVFCLLMTRALSIKPHSPLDQNRTIDS